MAEEIPPRSGPETGKESLIDPSPSTHGDNRPTARRSHKRRRNILILAVLAAAAYRRHILVAILQHL